MEKFEQSPSENTPEFGKENSIPPVLHRSTTLKTYLVAGLAVLVVFGAGFSLAYSIINNKKTEDQSNSTASPSPSVNSTQTVSSSSASSSTPSASASASSSALSQLIWRQGPEGWDALQAAPDCAATLELHSPADLTKATSILYPGQTRGGNYKPHGGFRFDTSSNTDISVTAPIDGYIVRGGQYLSEGEIQYTFDVMNNCGVMYRVGHIRSIPDNLMAIANTWPAAKENSSATESVNPAVFVKQGDILGTSVGLIASKNVFFDWGVYDYRSTNTASASAAYQKAHASEKELAWHAVCWFDWLSASDEAAVRALPAGDPTSGKKSDYCL